MDWMDHGSMESVQGSTNGSSFYSGTLVGVFDVSFFTALFHWRMHTMGGPLPRPPVAFVTFLFIKGLLLSGISEVSVTLLPRQPSSDSIYILFLNSLWLPFLPFWSFTVIHSFLSRSYTFSYNIQSFQYSLEDTTILHYVEDYHADLSLTATQPLRKFVTFGKTGHWIYRYLE
ncbi:hypothetical protein F4804DRAFT_235732 [Jackrogersella minutella]|nr:hypothetical protein F4804DRAFT_235732 [Jackrogersella minutella]